MRSNLQSPSTSNSPTRKSTVNMGYKHILLRKLSYAVISSVSSQLIILLWFIFLVNFSLLNPLDSVNVYVTTMTTLSTWAYVLLFISVVFAQSIICAKEYIVAPSYNSTRFAKVKAIFSLHNMLLLVLHIFVGFAWVWLFLAFTSLQILSKQYKHYVLEENTLYLLYLGAWIGFFYFISVYTSEKKVMFPVVHQQKWLQFKANLFDILKRSKQRVFWPVLYFVVFYALMGQRLNQILPMEVHYQSLQLRVCILAWFLSTLIYFSMNLIHFYYSLFLTEPYEFCISPQESGVFTLKDALEVQVPIIQHLACQDIFLLVANSQTRRGLLFTLSFPGNHPHTWNSIIHNLLQLCKDYTDRLNTAMNTILLPEKTRVGSEESTTKGDPYTNSKVRRIGQCCSPNGMNLVQIRPISSIEQTRDQLMARFGTKLDSLVAHMKEKLGINFLLRDLPEASIQRCLGEGQMIIWVAQSLSALCAISLEEDRYGIAQKDLPVIITTLVEMKISVEKLNRLPALNRRGPGLDDFNCKMKLGIMNALKRSIFHLVRVFGPYLSDLNLKSDIYAHLCSFHPVKNGHCY